MDKSMLKEFAFKDMALKIELLIANDSNNLNFHYVNLYLKELFPFSILSTCYSS
jgi:hypothetical protein